MVTVRGKILPATVGAAILLAALISVPRASVGSYLTVEPPRALDGISLAAKDGRIDRNSLAGRWTFLVIGYTSCPDVCPTVLSNLAAVRAEMAQTLAPAALPQMMFVSVDPERDSPDYLADYVANFGKGFVGATGKRPAIDALVRKLGAYYRLGRKDKDGFYLVSHSAEIYLIGPQVRLRARFIPPLDPRRTLADFVAFSGNGPHAAVTGPARQ